MSRRIIIEMEGVAVEAVLNEHKCPQICQGLWDILPYAGPVINGMWSGDVFRTVEPVPIPKAVWSQFSWPRPGIEDRSFKCNMNPGDVVFYPGDGINELCIGYGEGQFREGPAGPTYVNHVATIDKKDPNFVAFMQKCAELGYKGSKVITYRRKE